MSTYDQYPSCPACGATTSEPCRRGPGPSGDGLTSCGDGLTNIIVAQPEPEPR